MALKLKFVIISAIYFLCYQSEEVNAICQLDHMKRYALNACEMLIEALKAHHSNPHQERVKREIWEPQNTTRYHYDKKRHIRPTHLRIHERSFPAGGYIVVDHWYAKILRMSYPSTYHVIPKNLYHPQDTDTNRKHRSKYSDENDTNNEVMYRRRKRHDQEKNIINFTYCCVNECKPYDFCEL